MPKLSKALATLRKREAGRFFIRGVGSAEIAEALTKDGRFGSVSLRQTQRDLEEFKEELHRLVEATELYSLNYAFHELAEIQQAAWVQYMRPPMKVVTPKGEPVVLDDREIKLSALDRVLDVVIQRCRLSGFFTPKVLEQLVQKLLASPQQTNTVPVEKLLAYMRSRPLEEQNAFVEALKNGRFMEAGRSGLPLIEVHGDARVPE